MSDKNILMLVEGEKTDVQLMEFLCNRYEFDESYHIVSFCTNIYVLYQYMFQQHEEDMLDLREVLVEHRIADMGILELKITDTLLIFDFDPQDPLYTSKKILQMQNFSKNRLIWGNYI